MHKIFIKNSASEYKTKADETFAEVAKSNKLKNMVAVRQGDTLQDLSTPVTTDGEVAFIPADSPDGLEIIRHSTAHLLADAVKKLYPDAQVTIGPVVENGFYYDFAYEPGFKPEDFAAIEKAMKQIVKKHLPIERLVWTREEAVAYFEGIGEHFKAEIIRDLDDSETISLYKQGDFIDLCRGPHVPHTGFLGAFKLTKVAGAYWRGDSDNQMLQRIYGTAWDSQEALAAYLHQLDEAEKRDHRKLAKAMNLFHFQDEAPGMVFWHHEGYRLYQTIVQYMRQTLHDEHYEEIATPMIIDRKLWEASGHWEKFRDDMFVTEADERTYCVKPMNCPGGLQVYNVGLKSYRDLPLKMGEFGFVHRNELSGALHGLMRLRAFTQDDAHVFCTSDQLDEEVAALIKLVYGTYHDFGFKDIEVRLATRPEKRIGSDADWDLSEAALARACDALSIPFTIAPNEGAFYGPKIEFHLRDCIGRVWQCGTIQVDYSMPARLGATYIDPQGQKAVPIMIHRAIFGSLERFIGILLEHYAGRLPLWLAPTQIAILTVADQYMPYAEKIYAQLKALGLMVKLDDRSEKLGFKIRDFTLRKVPYQIIVGEQEMQDGTIAVRSINGKQETGLDLAATIQSWQEEIASKLAPDADGCYGLFQSKS